MDEARWSHLSDLFERLLEGGDPAAILRSEPDPEVRVAAENLWRHHVRAAEVDFLGEALEFEVMPVFQPGQVLLSRFRIESLLGRGGMGEVYLAFDIRMEERVALKTVARFLSHSPTLRQRIVAEVQSARRVTHSNVCRIHELFEDGEIVFFSMEYVHGALLSDLMLKPPSRKHARMIVQQMAEGLHAAHLKEVVHGDFKPANVMVVPGNVPRAVIMDFGLALALDRTVMPSRNILAVCAGTLDYMAPELLDGCPPTVQSDVFAFGKVASQLLPGRKMWDECTCKPTRDRITSLDPIIQRLRRDTARRYWIGGAILAGAVAPAWSILGNKDNVGRLEAGARLLVNGFRAASDIIPGARLTRALLITALQQSPRLHAITDYDLLPALRQLAPRAGLPIEGDILRRLVRLQRASHWIDGSLTQSNGRWSLSLRVWRVSNERLLAETAFQDFPALAALAEQTAVWMRQLAGESRQSLEANPSGVASYTSEVPEALQKYYGAMEHYAVGEMEPAIPLLEEATRLDAQFAQAHNALGICLNALRRHVEALASVERARRLAPRLPERERAWIEAFYQQLVQDPVKMVEATRRNLEYYPDEPRFCRVFAQTLCWVGRAPESVPYIQKAVELAPQNDLLRNELTVALCEAGRFEEGLQVYQEARAMGRSNPYLGHGAGLSYLGLERYAEAEQAFVTVPGDSGVLQAGAKILLGDLDSAVARLRQELARRRTEQNPAAEHRVHEFLCGTYYLTDRLDLARAQVASMADLQECPALGWQLQCSAFWAARVGDDEVLGRVASQLERIARQWPNGFTRATLAHSEALQSWRRRDIARTEALLLESLGSAFTIWTLFDLADFYGATSRVELAEEYWQKFEAARGTVLKRWFTGVVLYGWLNRGLAARRRGDRALASMCASKVLKHWSRNNPGTRLVQTAKSLAANLN